MRLTLEYPSDLPDASPEFLSPDAIATLAEQAQRLGFDAIALSDHPAPSMRWRRAGGHDTFEPAVALAFMAAVTTRIRLMTNLYVLPFRNPYLTAKALTSLDVVSAGRLIAGVGAGYLRSEFHALGAAFENRAADFDASLDSLVRIWTEPECPVTSEDFGTSEPVALTPPVQRPHPPIWIGGNSAAARRRVVRYGSGWSPVLAPPSIAASVRTATLDTAQKFGAAVARLHQALTDVGRDPAEVSIQVELPTLHFDRPGQVRHELDRIGELYSLGATHAIVHADPSGVAAARDYLEAVTSTVSSHLAL